MKIALAPLEETDADALDGARLLPERAEDEGAIMTLVERAFGPGRYAKVSERLREGNRRLADLSFCVLQGDVVVGTVRQWPVLVGGSLGLFLGPIAVEAAHRSHGFGAALISRCVEAAAAGGWAYILLVGDLPVFGPHGFVIAPQGRILMPTPVAPHRLLVLPLAHGVLETLEGPARAPPSSLQRS
jgi:predicted N-acetyltransferase YhbS